MQHGSIPQHMHQLHFHSLSIVTRPPPLAKLECTTTVQCGNKIMLTGYSPCEQCPLGISPCHQLRTTLIAQQWDLTIELIGAQWEMQVALSQGVRYAVSDGSFKDMAGAAAWIIKESLLHMH